jgi:hypothetical protein
VKIFAVRQCAMMPQTYLSQCLLIWLSIFAEDNFKESPGCDDAAATPGRAADALKHGLWACWDILQRCTVAQSCVPTIM